MSEIRRGTVRAALQSRAFRLMFVGSFMSNIGTWMQNVVLPAYIYNRTGRASLVGIFIFAQLGPLLVLSIPAGVIADRFDRRKWLICTQVIQMSFAFLLFPLTANDSHIALIFFAQLGVGIGNALNAPAWSASLPSLVPPEDLPGAISLNSTVINGSRVIGPIVVALLANWGIGTSQVFLINSLTYLFVIVALLRVTIPHLAPVGSDEGWRQLTTGIRIARERRVIGRLLLSLATFSFLSLPYVGLFPAVARLNFDIDETGSTYRWLYATWGLGAAIGGLAIGTVLVSVDKRTIIRAGFAFFALFLALFGIANTPLLAFVVAFPLGIAYFGTTTAMMTVLQSRLAPNERGRVMSLWFMSFGGTVPIGNLVFGPVIDAVGARWVLVGGAAWALFLAWWCNVKLLEGSAPDQSHYVVEPDDT
jgi:MFS family permease